MYVEYRGPQYLIYNSKTDCVKGIERPIQRTTLESYDQEGYRDPALMRWVPTSETDMENRSKPTVLQISKFNVIYCLYSKILINGVEASCPARPFKLPKNWSFKLPNATYDIDSEFVSFKNRNERIKTPTLGNVTDAEFEKELELLLNLKRAHEGSVRPGVFGFSKGTLTIPLEPIGYIGGIILSAGGSALTFYKYCMGSKGGSSSYEHQESHSESINITE